jgi:hypothetical protein
MQPNESKEEKQQPLPQKPPRIPGLVGAAKVSKGLHVTLPKAVCQYWPIEPGDTLEFYNQFVDIPDELAANYRLIAVVIRKKDDDVPYGPAFMPGLHKVTTDVTLP